MNHFQIICGNCHSEVKQEGAYFRCQNLECQTEVPIDPSLMKEALAMTNQEQATQTPWSS